VGLDPLATSRPLGAKATEQAVVIKNISSNKYTLKQTKHIVQTWILSLLLSLIVSPVLAEDAEMSGLHCGEVVTLTATPDAGYRFVQWSDGNTDNPRDIEITEAVSLSAIYEPVCNKEIVPVSFLYDELLIINAETLHQLGYTFSEQNVTWYRIVGDKDDTHQENDDQIIGYGYYYTVPQSSIGGFYAAVDVGQTPSSVLELCSQILYSKVVWIGLTGLHSTEADIDKEKVIKIIVDNKLYIIKGDEIYRADGSQVK